LTVKRLASPRHMNVIFGLMVALGVMALLLLAGLAPFSSEETIPMKINGNLFPLSDIEIGCEVLQLNISGTFFLSFTISMVNESDWEVQLTQGTINANHTFEDSFSNEVFNSSTMHLSALMNHGIWSVCFEAVDLTLIPYVNVTGRISATIITDGYGWAWW
jgi:hypothetical protein